ncbi:MAG TPA: DUF3467 domain-containing protein [Planctomycetaceae bacterium]|nr:DUF3467 domain-containing protein [Planctomycetaceae bacterium]
MTDDLSPEDSSEEEGPQSQEIRHAPIGALVPAHLARGVFTTGAVVLQGQHEFIVDFLLRMQQPQQVVARIVMPAVVVNQFIMALQENIHRYEERFGPIHMPVVPNQPPQHRQSAQDLYETLKIGDDVQSGSYANAVMIGHSPTEFSFDFITTFFPRSSVSQRVFMASANAKRLLDSLNHSFQQFQQRLRNPPPPPPTDDYNSGPPDFNTPEGDWPPGM